MADILITAPATEPVSLTELKMHLRVDGTTEDALLTSLIQAAREYAEEYQGIRFITQTRELVLDDFPVCDYIELPGGNAQSVTSVKYKDSDGTETTMDSGDYILDGDSFVARVVLAYNVDWPSFTPYPTGAVRVRYVVGYGSADDVPKRTKQAMLMMISHWYEHREGFSETDLKEVPFAVKALLNMDRVMPI